MKGAAALLFCCSLFSGCSDSSKQVKETTTEITETADQDVKQDFKELDKETAQSIKKDSTLNEESISSPSSITSEKSAKSK